MWVDGFKGVADHLRQNMNFAIVTQAVIRELQEWGRERNWHGLRLVSSHGSGFKSVLDFEDNEGKQRPGPERLYAVGRRLRRAPLPASAQMTDEIKTRGIDLLSPVWNLLDITPEARGQWDPKLTYC
jgi:predicted dithiol-disulfide oxidoreductase (DUF899 family)